MTSIVTVECNNCYEITKVNVQSMISSSVEYHKKCMCKGCGSRILNLTNNFRLIPDKSAVTIISKK